MHPASHLATHHATFFLRCTLQGAIDFAEAADAELEAWSECRRFFGVAGFRSKSYFRSRACLNNPEYVVFKEVVVKKELLNEVKDKLVSINIKSYVEARRIIEDIGLPNSDEVLAELGFKVKWRGLDIEEATIGLR